MSNTKYKLEKSIKRFMFNEGLKLEDSTINQLSKNLAEELYAEYCNDTEEKYEDSLEVIKSKVSIYGGFI